uniref:Uncharacterized protein n=1 Tax=Manihot esculenta TaxID=3983 RepID=A0A2C9UXL0_MANES
MTKLIEIWRILEYACKKKSCVICLCLVFSHLFLLTAYFIDKEEEAVVLRPYHNKTSKPTCYE